MAKDIRKQHLELLKTERVARPLFKLVRENKAPLAAIAGLVAGLGGMASAAAKTLKTPALEEAVAGMQATLADPSLSAAEAVELVAEQWQKAHSLTEQAAAELGYRMIDPSAFNKIGM